MNIVNSTSKGIFGIDEAGRGPLAGPLVVAGVILTIEQQKRIGSYQYPIRDSKTLSDKQREQVYTYLIESGILFKTVCIDVSYINEKGIGWANTEGIKQVITHFPTLPECVSSTLPECVKLQVIVDGYFPVEKIAVEGVNVKTQVDADATVLPVMLAGIVAKVTRDRMMGRLHEEFPIYNWIKNKGYGTKQHIQALVEYGSSIYHRRVFVETALKNLHTNKSFNNHVSVEKRVKEFLE